MKSVASPLVYKALPPRRPAAGPAPAIILLHGRGSDENDLFGLSEYLDERLAVFSLRAPLPFEFGGYTYFQLNDDGSADREQFLSSYEKLVEFVDGVARLPEVDGKRLYLMGFSMGTIMSYAVALTHPEKFAGVIAQSGFVRDHPDLVYRWKDLAKCPFIITHGTYDEVLPVSLARETRELFRQSNAEVVYKEYPMGHEINGESLADVVAWLKKRLGG